MDKYIGFDIDRKKTVVCLFIKATVASNGKMTLKELCDLYLKNLGYGCIYKVVEGQTLRSRGLHIYDLDKSG